MNRNIKRFYTSAKTESADHGRFHASIALHEEPLIDWDSLHKDIPLMPRGWFELCSLTTADRIEFVLAFWLSKLPYVPKTQEYIARFFHRLDDIGIFAYQQAFDSPWEVRMVYSLADGSSFFQGAPPAAHQEIESMTGLFANYVLPKDYLGFLQIHNGFSKYNDSGMIPLSLVPGEYEKMCRTLAEREPAVMLGHQEVNPHSLIPFYQSFHLPAYQCFYGEWYPNQEMGNVYFSGIDFVISDYRDKNGWIENLAFPSFLDWLVFYLESIEEL